MTDTAEHIDGDYSRAAEWRSADRSTERASERHPHVPLPGWSWIVTKSASMREACAADWRS
jgi:hypothetical protein